MSRYRLFPNPARQAVLQDHCGHARYLWNLAVEQQALRDFTQAMTAFLDPANPAGRPSWRKARRHEGFRIVGRRGRQWDVRRVSRKVGQVWVPKAGWVRFRWSRKAPGVIPAGMSGPSPG